jgi:STE24 endopeptidase
MSLTRAVAILLLVAVAAAIVVGLASRAPEALRFAKPPPDATDPSLGAHFTTTEIARNGAYRGPQYLALALGLVVAAVALVLLARVFVPRTTAAMTTWRGGWAVQTAVVAALITIVLAVVALPLGYVCFSIDHAWRLSTQGTGPWLLDEARSLAVGVVTAAVAALAFIGVIRAFPRSWWAIGWLVFTVLTVVMTYLAPIVIAPLFNKFTPLPPGPLKERIVTLAHDAGVDLDDVLVADASKRSTVENAYVTGIGSTKRMVLYDTLIDAGDDRETAFVAAHELGHEVRDHIWKGIGIASAGLLIGFAALLLLSRWDAIWSWTGATGIGDPRALPLIALAIGLASLISLPVQNSISRAFERQADTTAIELTHDPATAVGVFRRFAFSNLADLKPPRIAVWALFSHPPIPERIREVSSVAGSDDTP